MADASPAAPAKQYKLLSVIVPVYNERNTVLEIIRRMRRAEVPIERAIIIVDARTFCYIGGVPLAIELPRFATTQTWLCLFAFRSGPGLAWETLLPIARFARQRTRLAERRRHRSRSAPARPWLLGWFVATTLFHLLHMVGKRLPAAA